MRLISTTVLAALALGSVGTAQFTLSKLFYNPIGADDLQEAIEIRGPASTSLAGYSLLVIEGDATGAGVVDVSMDLSTYTTGTNGLLLIRSDAGVIAPAPDVATSVVVFNWTPDLENGSNTYVLGSGTAPAAATDLDADNDGTFDAGVLVGYTVNDAVGILESDMGVNVGYGDDLGFLNIGPFAGPTPLPTYTPDALIRYYNANGSPCAWAGGDVAGVNPGGPYNFFNFGVNTFGFAEQGITSNPTIELGTLTAVPDSDGDGVANGCDGCPNDPAKTAPGLCGCGIPEGCSLGATPETISISAGGVQTMSLFGGAGNAGQLYFLVGSLSGTSPGFPVDSVVLPLNPDAYFIATLTPNTPLLAPSLSFLNGSGNGTCNFTIPAGTVLGGVPFTAHHAYVVFNLGLGVVTFASNAAPVTLVP
ncbi:MAG: hypothetical protein FJ299_11890 [Planctomycetes bacterium]|nr:hypothetical protein [Planctomycetota bacterium]